MKNLFSICTLGLLVISGGIILSGCGNSEADAKKAMVTDASTIDKNKQARQIFDSVGGDVGKLTQADKDKLKSLYGPDLKIDGLFAAMSRKVAMPGPPKGR